MDKITHGDFSYELITRPWIKGDKKHEVIKYPKGLRNLWGRITYKQYLEIYEQWKLTKNI